jgi:hypothetical protein
MKPITITDNFSEMAKIGRELYIEKKYKDRFATLDISFEEEDVSADAAG